ncbi:unnamed protein product [Effrenium voratum]|uniref:Serine hydroxymethyltransferase-like domain-containing protein n=1 Tax=Effrenium voratum TaxID=2562239 RepID=A0AA36J7Y5_9DINO|nr:unnamed protein product [Effrenium voratum]
MILCGASAYPRVIDFGKFRAIADEVGAILMADIAHISGLVATGEHPSPFEACDVVTTTTHKSLRGPRAGMIFFKYSEKIPDIKERIDMAVFPALQGGPHNHQIGGLAAQLLEVDSDMFKTYAKQVKANAKALAEALMSKDHKLASDGTDNHLLLWDLRPHGLTGSKVEKVCEAASITLNRNAVHGDASALSPGGVRVGTPAMTTRGCSEQDFQRIGEFLDRCCRIALKIQAEKGKKLKDFEAAIVGHSDVLALKKEVEEWAVKFGYPGALQRMAACNAEFLTLKSFNLGQVMLSASKYIGGHSDMTGGALVTGDEAIAQRLAALAKSVGAIASPFEAYLALRGMKTLAVRMERQCSNAQRVAEFLEKHPQVTEVHYPGLTSHPQHELCMRQMRSGGAVVTVRLKGSADSESDLELMRRFFGRLQIWVLAESLGGVESMINHSATMSHGSMTKEQRAEVGVYDTTLRLSVGLEDIDDLLADLEHALS